jgi:CRISPR-associated exonuclease Cas4
VATATRTLIAGGRTPRLDYEKKRCDGCSLVERRQPQTTGTERSAAAWLEAQIDA